MSFPQRSTIAGAVAIATVLSAGTAAMARSYSGNWPVTVTNSQRSNGTYCLTLTEGSRKSGSASLVANGQKYNYGSFFIINGIFMATIQEPLYGQNGALTFTGRAAHGRIGSGIYENIEGGSNFDFGSLSFGMKGGC